MAGIKETSDLVRLGGAVLAAFREAQKDGLGFDDVSLLLDGDFINRAQAAFDGISDVPSELGDLSWPEVMRLVQAVGKALS